MTDNIMSDSHPQGYKLNTRLTVWNIYCENTLSQQGIHEELFTFVINSIPQNQSFAQLKT